MKYSFKIKLLARRANMCRIFNSKEAALEHVQELAQESEAVPARLVITNGERLKIITLSCPLFGIAEYLQDFSVPLDNMIPEPPGRRRPRARGAVRY